MSTPHHSSNTGGATNNSNGRNNNFGRDEFNALLGGPDGLSEVITRRSIAMEVGGSVGRKINNSKDISDMTVEETAALLKQQQQQKVQSHNATIVGSQRLRATSNRVREYHKLLDEQQQQQSNTLLSTQQQQKLSSFMQHAVSNSKDEKDDHMNDTMEPPIRRRKKAAPVILVELGITEKDSKLGKPQPPPKRRDDTRSDNDDDDDDDDTSTDAPPQRSARNHRDSSSDDSDSSSVDERRRRALHKRKQLAPVDISTKMEQSIHNSNHVEPNNIEDENVRSKDDSMVNPNAFQRSISEHIGVDAKENSTRKKFIPVATKDLVHVQSKSASDESEDSESSSSSDDDDSESDDDGVVKPIFIPKHRRTMIQSMADEQAQQMENEQEEKELKERRKRESRALVQETLMNAKLDRTNTNNDDMIDGITGAMNDIPTDNDDDNDRDARYEEWEVRELERIIHEWDIEVEKLRSDEERNQRRRRYAPGKLDLDDETNASQHRANTMQSISSSEPVRQRTGYHHRGAFYMDDNDDNDIRQKAMEYGQVNESTVVLHDHQHRDRSQLPKVMQVKKFGFANQSKYKGLAAEDTTDKSLDILPIVHKKNRSTRFK